MTRRAERCPHCNAGSAAGAAFCISCGTDLHAARLREGAGGRGQAPEPAVQSRAGACSGSEQTTGGWRRILWIIVLVVLTLASIGLATVPAPSMNRVGQYRWIFALLGWRGTWIALACILIVSLIVAVRRVVMREKSTDVP